MLNHVQPLRYANPHLGLASFLASTFRLTVCIHVASKAMEKMSAASLGRLGPPHRSECINYHFRAVSRNVRPTSVGHLGQHMHLMLGHQSASPLHVVRMHGAVIVQLGRINQWRLNTGKAT
jgi:hypothetical protein